MRRFVIGIAACLIATGAICAPLHPYIALQFPDFGNPNLRFEPISRVRVGTQSIRLEVTLLKALQARVGGKIHFGGDAAGAASWLCFRGVSDKTPIIYWFVSNAEMGGGRITQVAVQKTDVGMPEGCSPAPPELATIDFGVPAFGSSQQDVFHYFKGGHVDGAGFVGYTSEHPAKGNPADCTRDQSVDYRIQSGAVSMISVSQVTSC